MTQSTSDFDKTAFDAAHKTVCALVEKFAAGAQQYLSPAYQEAEARTDFLDPFYIALGWDVRHETQINPYQQEVKIERGVSMSEGRKRADYAFYLTPDFNRVRFYVEAKKPSRSLRNPDDCFQAIRYGWNSNTPFAILTDFEETLLMDCRAKPDLASATSRVLMAWHYQDWKNSEKFARFYYLFAREAIAASSLENYLVSLVETKSATGRQKKLFRSDAQPVDVDFLKQLELWRTHLARDFHAADKNLSAAALTETTQRALDRLVFLRFLEDKGIETNERVSTWHGGDAWLHFISASRELDKAYNGVLWKKHGILDSGDFKPWGKAKSAWSDIAFQISSTQSPYLFNLIPIPILGSIYERFLGNEIEIDQLGNVHVTLKPEARKAGGVYYTPDYIVSYIVQNTVGPLVENKTPDEMSTLRFADIACGSGSFLLGVYDLLLRRHAEYFAARPKEAKKAGCEERDGVPVLSLKQRRAILENNIFGCDIDAQAVEVSKLSLYLKLLEDETATSARQFRLEFEEQILPDLENNIVCGNALIGFDVLNASTPISPEEERKLNPMDWKSTFPQIFRRGGFDAIVGNPPYGAELSPVAKSYIRENFKSYKYKYDSYIYFLEQAMKLTKDDGYVGYITPELWLKLESAEPLRELISKNGAIERILICGENIFSQAVVNTIVPILRVGQKAARSTTAIELENLKGDKWEVKNADWKSSPKLAIEYRLRPAEAKLIRKITQLSTPLSSFGEAIQGITAYDKYRGQDPELIKNRGYHSREKLDETYGKWLAGMDVCRYLLKWSGEWLSYGSWLGAPREPRFFEGPRLLFREIPGDQKRIQAAYAEETFYHGHSITPFKLVNGETSIFYLLGLINSSLLSWYGRRVLPNFGKNIFPKLNPQDIKALPIYSINFSNSADKTRHDEIAAKAQNLIAARAALENSQTETERRYSERKVLSLDRQIDELVYELYGLTPEGIELVEAGFGAADAEQKPPETPSLFDSEP